MVKRATLKDVAEKVGVTPATVSMVINNNKSIPQVTRDKVFAAIKELGYFPNPIARNLVKGKSDTLAVIAEFFYPLFFQQLLEGIEHIVAASSYGLHHMSSLRSLDKFNDQCRGILAGRTADGVIMLNKAPAPEIIADFNRFGIPMVVIENDVPGVHSISCNNFRGGYLAGEHLIKSGRKKILCVAGKENPERAKVQKDRIGGFLMALEDHGLKPFMSEPIVANHYYFSEGEEIYRTKMRENRGFDALFCAAGDPVAIGLLGAMKRDGIRVPDDVSLIGYDDLEFDPYISPSLTTIRQPGCEMGQRAAELVLELLGSGETALTDRRKIIFEPELVVRES